MDQRQNYFLRSANAYQASMSAVCRLDATHFVGRQRALEGRASLESPGHSGEDKRGWLLMVIGWYWSVQDDGDVVKSDWCIEA
jgi:hypothetical protein